MGKAYKEWPATCCQQHHWRQLIAQVYLPGEKTTTIKHIQGGKIQQKYTCTTFSNAVIFVFLLIIFQFLKQPLMKRLFMFPVYRRTAILSTRHCVPGTSTGVLCCEHHFAVNITVTLGTQKRSQ